MAIDSAAELPRHRSAGVRGLGDLETGLCGQPERILGTRGPSPNGAIRKIRHHHNLVRAWTIVFFFSSSGGAAVYAITNWGHK